MIEFRALTKEEVELRAAQVGDGWVQMLIYKDARCDMNILDETVGAENWMREHYECKGNLFCRVTINANYKNPEQEPRWISKADCGSESNTEKEKGESSVSFKRACVCWNIGRELYTKIPIFINTPTEQDNSYGGKSKYKLPKRKKFTVSNLRIDKKENKIVYLTIADETGKQVFEYKDEAGLRRLTQTSNFPGPKYDKKAMEEEKRKREEVLRESTKECLPDEPQEAVQAQEQQGQADTPQEVGQPTASGKRRVRRQ
jgi:hypothetical protein